MDNKYLEWKYLPVAWGGFLFAVCIVYALWTLLSVFTEFDGPNITQENSLKTAGWTIGIATGLFIIAKGMNWYNNRNKNNIVEI